MGVLFGVLPGVVTSQVGASELAASDVVDASCFDPAPHSFTDVGPGDVFDTAVAWLVEAGITAGTGPGLFSPGAPVSRGQMAVFLWRAADSPDPLGEHGFNDVPNGAFYSDAVSWLVENGITAGTTATTFTPKGLVTRGQMAAFLWRAAGSPAPLGEHGFNDVPDGAFYDDAVSWLVENEIAAGTTETTFSPGDVVTRGQMATFLWRNACGPEPTGLQVAAGGTHSCAITDGTVSCWGENYFGQLGNSTNNGTAAANPTPTPVAGLSNVTAIAAGAVHTCALAEGTVSCWGLNDSGQLGNITNNGTSNPNPTPTPVAGLTNVTAIAAGAVHTCALAEGTVYCWGFNRYGQLGNNTNNGTDTANPTPAIVAGLSPVTAITAGFMHTCAVAAGTASCWGLNNFGQLGNITNNGTSNPNPTPTPVAGLTNVTAIAAGAVHTCALAEGTVYCWGFNRYGQLGNNTNNGTDTANPTPAIVAGLSPVTAITAGFMHTCAVAAGTASCWGLNNFGQLGNNINNGTVEPNPTPSTVAGLANVTALAAGEEHTCGIAEGTVSCWGRNRYGQLGNDSNNLPNPTPTAVAGLANVVDLSAGGSHTCGVADGTVSCWGVNKSGSLGNNVNNGNLNPNPTPTPVAGLTSVTAVTAGNSHTCGIADGTVSCWGLNFHGQLGNTDNNGNNTANPTPALVAGLG